MRLLLCLLPLLAFSGCAGALPGGGRPPSLETTSLHGMSIRPERAAYAAGDSIAFFLAYRAERGPDGEFAPAPGYGLSCDRRMDRWGGGTWERVPGERWRPGYRAGAPIICIDVQRSWRLGASGVAREAYRLREDAAPGWYRWCTTVALHGVRGERWLCSEVFRVRRARRAG